MTARVMRPKSRRPRSLRPRQVNRANQQEEETVALLKELQEEFCPHAEGWNPKRATWTMAILAAEGRLKRKASK